MRGLEADPMAIYVWLVNPNVYLRSLSLLNKGTNWGLGLTKYSVTVICMKLLRKGLLTVSKMYFKNALYLSVNVFSRKVLIGDTIFTSLSGDGTAILRGHLTHAKV